MPIAISAEQRALQGSIRDWAQRAGTVALAPGPVLPTLPAVAAGQASVAVALGTGTITGAWLPDGTLRVSGEPDAGSDLASVRTRAVREITGRSFFHEVFLDEVFVPDDCLAAEAVHAFLLSFSRPRASRPSPLCRCLSIAGRASQILLSVVAERALGLPREEAR